MNMNRNDILDIDLRSIFSPKVWIVIVAIPHTLFLVIVPIIQSEIGSVEFQNSTFALLNTIYLASIYFLTSGKNQSRMVAIFGGSVFLWILINAMITEGSDFGISAQLTPPFIYKFSFSIELAPPLLLWGLLSLSGVLHWNEETSVSESIENLELTEL